VAVRIGLDGKVELVVPRGCSDQHALAFLRSRAEWIRRHVESRRRTLPPEAEFPPTELHIGLTGERWRIFRRGGSGRPRLVVQPATAPGSGAGVLELRGIGGSSDWRRCLLLWLRGRAREELGARLAAQARRHGFTYAALSLRSQRTRWGSCSARGAISLNIALLFQREDVVRYLLCHELAHTRHMNHSPRFWRCVGACEPRWRELDAALLQGWRNVPRWLMESA
jgi:predicted metal-dependent hydrolase